MRQAQREILTCPLKRVFNRVTLCYSNMVVRRAGFEPATGPFREGCSVQLSYRR